MTIRVEMQPASVEIVGSDLLFRPLPETRPVRGVDVFRSFLRVRTAEQVHAFAAMYGALGLCAAHDLPRGHVDAGRCRAPRTVQHDGQSWKRERLTGWFELAEAIRSTVRLGQRFRAGDVALDDLAAARSAFDYLTRSDRGAIPDDGFAEATGITPDLASPISSASGEHSTQDLLNAILDALSQMWERRMHIRWTGRHPEIVATTPTAFDALVLAIVPEMARDPKSRGAIEIPERVECDGCGARFHPTRKRKPGARSYCHRKKCRVTARDRINQARRRADARAGEGNT